MHRRLLLVAAIVGLSSAVATGAPSPEALRGELQARTDASKDARAEAARLRDEIAKLDAQLTELRAVEAAGAKGRDAKQARLDALNAREAALSADMGKNQSELSRLLGALELYRRNPPPALLISPGSARDAVRAQILVRALVPELERRAAVFRARAEALQRVRRSIASASADLFASDSALADGRAAIEADIRHKTALERQLDADSLDQSRRAQALAGQLRSLGLDPRIRVQPAAPAGPPRRMLAPVEGTIVRRFGQAAPDGDGANGLSWRAAPGAAVRAPAAGIVEYSGPLKGWGAVLILNAGGGYQLVLAGLDKLAVGVGRQVSQGQMLGAMPGERSRAAELYMEVRKEGAPIDPGPWLATAASR